LLVDFVVMIVW